MQFVKTLSRPDELVALLWAKFFYKARKPQVADAPEDMVFCYEVLTKVSRSFAVVIQELGDELRDAVCIFYLVLRALDTVEDDMSVKVETKVDLLRNFHKFLYDPEWTMTGIGEGHERKLLEKYTNVTAVFSRLDKNFQDVIADITRRMGEGMAEFSEREVVAKEDYDLYCHYVAGLVGIGLSGIFAHCGLEDPGFKNEDHISNEMGLFLQKTNIIRDYREDLDDTRTFWPREIWSQYSEKLENFANPKYEKEALRCLNHLVTDAMAHIPSCLDYMGRLRDPYVFKFCGIPQCMAIATLAVVYNNRNVFHGVVKIRRGEAAKIIMNLNSMEDVYWCFYEFCEVILAKIDDRDPNAKQLREHIDAAYKILLPKIKGTVQNGLTVTDAAFAGSLALSALYMGRRFGPTAKLVLKSRL